MYRSSVELRWPTFGTVGLSQSQIDTASTGTVWETACTYESRRDSPTVDAAALHECFNIAAARQSLRIR